MIVQNSAVAMASHHELFMQHSRRETTTAWVDRPVRPGSQDKVQISPEAKAMNLARGGKEAQGTKRSHEAKETEDRTLTMDEMKMQLVRHMVEMLTGRKIQLIPIREMMAEAPDDEDLQALAEVAQSMGWGPSRPPPGEGPPPREGWGMTHDVEEFHYEKEQVAFAAAGTIKTADGQEISFNVEMSMTREFMQSSELHMRAGDAALKDPLVINYAGNAAELTTTQFSFDLDVDGSEESIAALGAGSGYLALDRNEDGQINNGSELFGPLTGAGFDELASHDADGNQWIDEADPIFKRLKIWTKDAEGKDKLFALAELDVGAIHLGNVQSPFRLTNAANDTLGQVRSTGIFLKENGTAGTVQQLDLAV